MHMIFNDVEIDSNQYFEVVDSLHKLKNQVCEYFNMDMYNLRWYHVVTYLQETYKVTFVYKELPKQFNGKTSRYGNNLITVLNTNDALNDGRKHFTAMHEVTHAVLHLDGPVNNRTFYSNSVTEVSHDLKEIQADIGASELMMPSEAIYEACCDHQTFRNMCNTFEVSYGALNTRLLNYLVFEKQMELPQALSMITDFRYRNNMNLDWYIQYSDAIIDTFSDVETEAFGQYHDGFDGYKEYVENCYPEFFNNVSLPTVLLIYKEHLALSNPDNW